MSNLRQFVSTLRAAAHPFVHRVFRGRRLRKYTAISGVLGLLSVLMGAWLAFGNGEIEHETRVELQLEQSYWERTAQTFTYVAPDVDSYESALAEQRRLAHKSPNALDRANRLGGMVRQARDLAAGAAASHAPAQYRELQERAAALVPAGWDESEQSYSRDISFEWSYAPDVAQLQAAVDAELVPHVELYSSPLSLRDGVRVIGLVAGGVGLVMLLVGAPLFAGAQIAQEANENTLQPLLGTRLSARSLVLGLTSAPMAAAGLFAAPQLAICTLAGLVAGNAPAVLGFLTLTVVTAFLLTMLTQLLGYGMGRRWAAGLVGTVLTAALVLSMMAAVGFGFGMRDEFAGLVSIVPQVGSIHLLCESFTPLSHLSAMEALMLDARLAFATVAFMVLAVITVRALERRIAGRTQPAITRIEALVAAVTLILMAVSSMPELGDRSDATPLYFVTLALVIIPFQVLLMGRVPVGDGPAKLRTVPLSSLLLEFALWPTLHAGVVLCIAGADFGVSIGGGVFVLWALIVAALAAIRIVAVPVKLLNGIYLCFVLFSAMLMFGFGAALCASAAHGHRGDSALDLFEVSPLLGLLQLGLFFFIPWSLVRSLRHETAGLK